VTNKLIM